MKLKKLAALIFLAIGSIGFTISANSSTLDTQAASADKIAKEAKTLSGKALFDKASKLYESSKDAQVRHQAYLLAKEGAKKNDADSQLLLSLMYEIGEGVDVDEVEAEMWRQKAAKNGQIDAKGIIAIMGIAQDLDQLDVKKFKPFADEAYKKGGVFGVAAMAYVVHDGYGVEADEAKGQALLMKAMTTPLEELNFFERIYMEDIQSLVLEIE